MTCCLETSIEFGLDQGWVLQQVDDLGPDPLIKQILSDGLLITNRLSGVAIGVRTQAAIVIDFASAAARRCAVEGIPTALTVNEAL